MKRFMQFSIGVLCLSIAALIGFHVGNQSAQAQGTEATGFTAWQGGNGSAWTFYVLEANGDLWVKQANWGASATCGGSVLLCEGPPVYMGNFWGEQPIQTAPSTLGGVKSKYAPKKP